jgi:hypothetical protein
MTSKPVPPGKISRKLWEDAQQYLKAAAALIGNVDNPTPTYFLLSHALELIIKSYLAAKGFTAGQLRDFGHDIQAAFNEAIAHDFQIERQQEAAAMVRGFPNFIRRSPSGMALTKTVNW